MIRVAGYVKLAKLWEKNRDESIKFHTDYFNERYKNSTDHELVGVFVDITGEKSIAKRPEMIRLLSKCKAGQVDLVDTQTKAYLAANTEEFCFLIGYLFHLKNNVDIITEDPDYRINTLLNVENQRAELLKMSEKYIDLYQENYQKWEQTVNKKILKLQEE